MGVKLCSLCSHSATCSVRFEYNKFTYYLCKEHFYWVRRARRRGALVYVEVIASAIDDGDPDSHAE